MQRGKSVFKKFMRKMKFEKDGRSLHEEIPMASCGGAYDRFFPRDALISLLMIWKTEKVTGKTVWTEEHTTTLRSVLNACRFLKGSKEDLTTGEELNRIPHEWPGAKLENREGETTYNAADTTYLALIGAKVLEEKGRKEDKELVSKLVETCTAYASTHMSDVPEGNGKWLIEGKEGATYCLRCTYWKDSALPNRESEEIRYPVVYPLVQALGTYALKLWGKEEWKDLNKGLAYFFSTEKPIIAYELGKGGEKIIAPTSDYLHMLFYLDKEMIKEMDVKAQQGFRKILEKCYDELAYREGGFFPLTHSVKMQDVYHQQYIWVFEQMIILLGAKQFADDDLFKRIEEHCVSFFRLLSKHVPDGNPELFDVHKKRGEGQSEQLWSAVANHLFISHLS